MVSVWGTVKHKRIALVDARRSWPERWPILAPDKGIIRRKTGKPFRYTLSAVALYWAVKDILRKLSK